MDLGGEGEDSVHDHEEGGGDDPEELLEHAEVGLAVPDQAELSVEDQEGAKCVAEVHDDKEEMSGEVFGLDEDSADGDTVGGGGGQEEQEGQAETTDRSQEAWGGDVPETAHSNSRINRLAWIGDNIYWSNWLLN